MTNTNDLRYLRTEEAIRAAFMELVSQGPIASVTASALCQAAHISRNAFYLHHSSVTELYSTLVDELVADIRTESLASAERQAEIGTDELFNQAIISSLARHEDLLRVLFPSDDGSLTKCLVEGIEDVFVEAALSLDPHGASFEHRLHCAYGAGALVHFAACWIAGTKRPLTEGLVFYEQLNESVVKTSENYLLQTTGTV